MPRKWLQAGGLCAQETSKKKASGREKLKWWFSVSRAQQKTAKMMHHSDFLAKPSPQFPVMVHLPKWEGRTRGRWEREGCQPLQTAHSAHLEKNRRKMGKNIHDLVRCLLFIWQRVDFKVLSIIEYPPWIEYSGWMIGSRVFNKKFRNWVRIDKQIKCTKRNKVGKKSKAGNMNHQNTYQLPHLIANIHFLLKLLNNWKSVSMILFCYGNKEEEK